MFLDIVCILIGIVLVVWAADKFTDGAGGLARRLGVTEIVIGVTIVGFATSLPEFCISLLATIEGSQGIALGNVMGSNIFNVFAVVGIAAVIAPIAVSRSVLRKDIPWVMGSSLLVAVLMLLDKEITRQEGAIMILALVVFMVLTLRHAKSNAAGPTPKLAKKTMSLAWCIVWIILGLVVLVVGSQVFVRGAADLAERLGVSDAVIGITVVACGTSLPELAATVAAALKKQPGIALGNIIGSNVMNNLMIIGVTSLVLPFENVKAAGFNEIDVLVYLLSGALLWVTARTSHKIGRGEGLLLFAIFLLYMGWLVWSNTHIGTRY